MTPPKVRESNTPDIRIDTQFFGNLKTRKLRRAVGEHGVLCMIRLWCYVGERHPKGILNGMTVEDLEDVAGWTGEKGVFAAYALDAKWAEKTPDGGIKIHDWEEHQPYVFYSEKRKRIAKLGAEALWNSIKKQRVDATSMLEACRQPAPAPSPSLKNKRLNLAHLERAQRIVSHYEETIDEDKSTHEQAVKNVLKLLSSGIDSIVLGECMNLHLDEMVKIGRERGYRIIPSNFFGRKAVYKSYLKEAIRIVDAGRAAQQPAEASLPFAEPI